MWQEGGEMLYENVLEKCNEQGIPVTTLESKIGLGRGTIGKWANGQGNPSVKNVKKVADYFGVSLEELIGD